MPLALVQGDRLRPPFGFLPIRRLWLRTLSAPLKRSPPPSPGSRRSPPRRNRAPPRWPLWQARGWLAAHALDCQETIRDHAEPSNGDCQQIVGAALALAFSDRRKVEWRTEPSSWREPLRTSAIAGKAPNARVQRGRV